MSKYPKIGDMVYIADTRLPEYGLRGKVVASRTESSDYTCWWIEYKIEIGDSYVWINQDDAVFKKPLSRKTALALKTQEKRRSDLLDWQGREKNCLTQLEYIRSHIKELI